RQALVDWSNKAVSLDGERRGRGKKKESKGVISDDKLNGQKMDSDASEEELRVISSEANRNKKYWPSLFEERWREKWKGLVSKPECFIVVRQRQRRLKRNEDLRYVSDYDDN
ncbi:hypothetical protein PRIPAC_77999, partial [Pristionchus pacificus]|uniref:Uncharacterized protein n=1 Tax=Pristionchus pacificus TaxID=54126 RepID=A0A2A6CKX4_PRIPA